MKISKAKLRQIIKEELEAHPAELAYERLANGVGDLIRAALEEDGLDAGAIQDAIGEALSEELGVLREDADDDRDFEIEEATRDGDADGAAGRERTPPRSFASRYYNDAYDRASKKQEELEEGWGQGDRAYQQATHLLGKFANMHGLRNQVADALRQKRINPQDIQKAVQGAVSSYDVAQRLGLR